MELTFEELINSINGEIIKKESEEFNSLCTDTRKIQKNNIFLALKGENFNGNKYIMEAFSKGASIAIVDEICFEEKDLNKASTIIKVKDCNEALLSLAKYYREKLGIKVIGITGSTGKTSTKDLVAAFLSEKYKVFKTKGNFNNHIGLPLMILELDSSYDVAVLELGMSNLGEIHTLANCSRPDIALITNIGLSHIENLKTKDNILKAKMEITDFFNENSILIINGEDEYLNKIQKANYSIIKTGYNKDEDVYAENVVLNDDSTSFTVVDGENKIEFTLPMVGAHNVLNGLLAICACKSLNVTYEEMIKGINNIENTSMRLEFIKTDSITIINDCYNASPASMEAALDVLKNHKGSRKVAILGTMRELGQESEKAHEKVGEYARDKIDLLIVTGEYSKNFSKGFANNNIKIYDTKNDLIKSLKDNIRKGDVILVKASRGIKFEEVVNELINIAI
ncbi:MAG: UDP-N-acetylmuramoyl-tripeptide--D-alanyl-D-alanine ligase [Clostridiales bacterium]|nr:UDP-N-acetylmuramoyl-tripeptide--D-alanyl-D-alanine ligase [Clostridiales bacterium]